MSTYWKPEEDAVVVNHVKEHGEGDWNVVAGLLGRSANSCYQRWIYHLKPGLEHKDFTIEEQITIIRLHKEYGNQWATIVKKLSETSHLKRTANKIKNFWNGAVKKKALELNLEVDTDVFVTTMTQILRGRGREELIFPEFVNMDEGGVSWDHLSNGATFTLDDIPNRPF